ncbi:hypothetical protein F4778DRAFT_743712 [Xylariomycetidae sp. FL2044]|nr:hypothetical protein F4778DRAFT_743712 [Xylariomycetidae sp. FL2044]
MNRHIYESRKLRDQKTPLSISSIIMAESDKTILDLVDVALLLTYERCAHEPRFRHGKLREVAFPGQKLRTITLTPGLVQDQSRPHTQIVFEQVNPSLPGKPDLASNMVPVEVNPNTILAHALTPQQVDTLYYQARGHDACFTAVSLLQYFLDMFPADTELRIRHGPNSSNKQQPGDQYTTSLYHLKIIEKTLLRPRQSTVSVTMPKGNGYVSGDGHTMVHAVVGFSRPGSTAVDSVLDLSSLQFGDVGRGPGAKGQLPFALDTYAEFCDRLDKIAVGEDIMESKISDRIRAHPDDGWLVDAAKRAKKRWDERKTTKWCGYCGASGELKGCARCHESWYCDAAHQKMAWPFHKHYCTEKK